MGVVTLNAEAVEFTETALKISELVAGEIYVFSGGRWPLDTPLVREFVGTKEVSMKNGSLDFLVLRKEDGTEHLVLVDLVGMVIRAT